MDALEKFVEESSIPTVTVFNNDPSNHPFVIKFFNSPSAKVGHKISSSILFIEEFDIHISQHANQFICLGEVTLDI